MNEVRLLGNLGSTPELRYSKSGNPVCNFRMATNEVYTDAKGNKKTSVEWHRIVVWGKAAENCAKFLHSGSQVLVNGKIKGRKYKAKDGTDRFTTEIVAVGGVKFLDPKPAGKGDQAQTSGDADAGAAAHLNEIPDDDNNDVPMDESNAPF